MLWITQNNFNSFRKKGFLLIKNFFDKQKEIKPIEKKIGQIIETVAVQNKVKLTSRNIGKNYITLIKINREFGSIIYDAIEQIPEFISLISKPKVIRLMEQLTGFKNIGIAHEGVEYEKEIIKKTLLIEKEFGLFKLKTFVNFMKRLKTLKKN